MSDETPNPRAAIGGNNPPMPTREELYADLIAGVEALAKKGTDLPVAVTSGTVADSYVEVIKTARKRATEIDKVDRMNANRPLSDEIDANNSFFRVHSNRLFAMVSVLEARVADFHEKEWEKEREAARAAAAERQRIADEERERTAAAQETGGIDAEMAEERQERLDNAARAAEARIFKDAGPVRTDAGTIGSKKGLDFRIKNYGELDLNELRESFNVDAIDKAVRDHVRRHKKTRPLKGVEIFETSKLSIR